MQNNNVYNRICMHAEEEKNDRIMNFFDYKKIYKLYFES